MAAPRTPLGWLRLGTLVLLALLACVSAFAALWGRHWRSDVWMSRRVVEQAAIDPAPWMSGGNAIDVVRMTTVANSGGSLAISRRHSYSSVPSPDRQRVWLDVAWHPPGTIVHVSRVPSTTFPRLQSHRRDHARVGASWFGLRRIGDNRSWELVVPWPAVTLFTGIWPLITCTRWAIARASKSGPAFEVVVPDAGVVAEPAGAATPG